MQAAGLTLKPSRVHLGQNEKNVKYVDNVLAGGRKDHVGMLRLGGVGGCRGGVGGVIGFYSSTPLSTQLTSGTRFWCGDSDMIDNVEQS